MRETEKLETNVEETETVRSKRRLSELHATFIAKDKKIDELSKRLKKIEDIIEDKLKTMNLDIITLLATVGHSKCTSTAVTMTDSGPCFIQSEQIIQTAKSKTPNPPTKETAQTQVQGKCREMVKTKVLKDKREYRMNYPDDY